MKRIEVWSVDLASHQSKVEQYKRLLSDNERARADRFHFDVDQVGFTVFHGAVREILSDYLSVNPEKINFSVGNNGKPYLSDFPEWTFNLSHTKSHAMLAVAKGVELGVDLERNKRIDDYIPIAKRFFHPEEVSQLLESPAEEQQEVFFKFWTAKEAFVKTSGEGISFGLENFAVSLVPPASIVWIADEKIASANNYHLCYLNAPLSHTACLMYYGGPCVVNQINY